MGVARGGCGAEVAADAATVADLRGADGVRRARESREPGAQRPDKVAERDARAQPHAVGRRLPLVQFPDAAEVEEPFGAAAAEVQLDHQVGAAGQGHGVGMRRLHGQRLSPVGRA